MGPFRDSTSFQHKGPIKHENEDMAVMDAVQLLNAESDFESWMVIVNG